MLAIHALCDKCQSDIQVKRVHLLQTILSHLEAEA